MRRDPLVEIEGLIKDYRGLRPLRVERLHVQEGQSLALLGFDLATSEILVNILLGAIAPDAGSVRTFGRATSDIPDSDAWLASMDQFGLVSERASLVDQLTVEHNLALPFSLDLDQLPPDVRGQVRTLADEVGLSPDDFARPAGAVTPLTRARLRLGRAIAHGPRLVIAEHPNAPLSHEDARRFARELRRVAERRHVALIVMTADAAFAHAVADDVRTLQPATGELQVSRGWRRWIR